ncbi:MULTISPECIES: hypothetical protein [Leptospira]|uniref:Uncharacterized protein n=3 Tax=Leptospira TaxID=171 RepID=A0A4R9G5K3_9LEPT|nr:MULTISPECIES: hypothetical protein [Leptospira]PKA16680.1 hypothetical protein CH363_07890 [Leptospira haakeii]PKA20701.1 hypothetical protein CH377_07295 [Leptospira haakeii]TGK06027.1 hypothetical protein EHO58_09715 [Leptospira selangorensis]TGM12170.1 hypothetical protein EHQ81_13945 [Leptospira selangorensis]TGM14787.1 hypothetical protein EHQ82_18665 [Leptospira selangorensis]
MKTANIWHITSGAEFPVHIWKHPRINIELRKVQLKDYRSIELDAQDINVFYVNTNLKEWTDIKDDFLKRFELHPFVALTIISSPEAEEIYNKLSPKGKTEVLEYPVQPRSLRIILDRVIQTEFFKMVANEIGNSCLANVGFFEGVFELANKEYKDTHKANAALHAILEFEAKIKKNNEDINKAIERVNELKNQELLTLHERLKVSEIIDNLKTMELKHALELKKATERALEYSSIEEIEMKNILEAHTKLFEYTEQEIKDLVEENKRLRKELGLPENN